MGDVSLIDTTKVGSCSTTRANIRLHRSFNLHSRKSQAIVVAQHSPILMSIHHVFQLLVQNQAVPALIRLFWQLQFDQLLSPFTINWPKELLQMQKIFQLLGIPLVQLKNTLSLLQMSSCKPWFNKKKRNSPLPQHVSASGHPYTASITAKRYPVGVYSTEFLEI